MKGYERVARHNHWDDSLSLANVYFYLHGTAQRWYENNEENIPSWEIFKDQLGSVFGKKDNLRRQAEQKLKVRAQTRGETTEFYIQDVLRLCREVDAQMPEEERLSHLMKGVAEEVYRYLLPRDIATTDQFIAECRRVVALQGRRVTASKFERLPNVTSLGDLGDVTDLQSLIRQIVREEVQRALAPPREEPRISSLEEIVKEEVDKVLAPMSGINTFPMESAARSAPRNYRKNTWYAPKVEASGSRVEVRNTNEWRTPDGTPVCFHCGRPGHVVRYCRDRRRLLDERRDEMYQDRARTMTNSGRNNNSNDADQRVNTRRYRSPSPSPRRGSSPGRSATRRASQSPRLVKMTNNYIDIKVEGDTIRALVDSGASDSVISERFRVELKKTMFAETDVVLKVADDKVVKSKGRCTLKLEVNGHPENFEFVVLENCSHDVILGWDFFKATNAVIDCGLGELQLDDLPDLDAEGRDDGVYAIQDFVIPGRSSQRISVVNRSLVGIVNMEVTCSKELFIRKDVIFPSSLIEFEEGIGKIWITNGGLQPQMIPKGMNLGRMCDIETEHKEVDTMLERKVIQPSESPWSAPVVLVKKKDGTWRFCVDFRRLNHITKKDVYPLPRIDDVLDHLSSARYYSTMNLKTGYWQVEVDERDREKTAFVTPDGLYEFMVMPFGLCNAPATFERMMDNVLMGLKWNICLCYLDDIVVYSDTFEEHLERLSKVLSCLQQAGLTINPDKCLFGSTRIKILGHVVDKDGIQPDSEKVEAIKKFPVPKSVCDIQSYLGLCSYYRRFIKNFSKIAAPLQILLKKDQKFIWTQEQKDSFESLKKALMQKPVLGHFKESAITKLHTDASSYGLGAVLVQIQENQENPIAYASRTLSKAEKNYSTTERECLAVIWAIGKFRPYLYGSPFEVVSDHHSLCWLAGLKDPSGRLARWALKLQDFDATITYKSGVKHKDADCLSRYPLPESPALTSLTLVREQQNLDPDITKISNALNQGEGAERFEMKNGLLYKRNFDPLGRRLLLKIGMDLLGRFPLSDKGNRWIIVCTDYLTKYAIAKALPSGTAAEIATFILEEVILKHGAPREIITDRGRAFMSQMVKEVTSRCKISHLFTTAYHPQTNGLTERLNKTLGDMLSMYVDAEQRDWDSVLPYVIFAYNTAQQGSTRFSPFFLVYGREAETLLDVLLPYEDETSDHDFGDQMVTKAEEARQLARIHILRSQENNKYHYDQVHRSVEYRVGDLVWVFTPVRKTGLSEKLLKKYFGPYKITRKVSEVNYEVEALEQSSRRRRRSQKDVVHVHGRCPVRGNTIYPTPLFNPPKKYILSGILAFIPDEEVTKAMAPFGEILSIRPLPFPTENPLFKHLSSLRREVVLKRRESTDMPAIIPIDYMQRTFKIFVGEDTICLGCKRHGHIKSKCPFNPEIRNNISRTYPEAINPRVLPVIPGPSRETVALNITAKNEYQDDETSSIGSIGSMDSTQLQRELIECEKCENPEVERIIAAIYERAGISRTIKVQRQLIQHPDLEFMISSYLERQEDIKSKTYSDLKSDQRRALNIKIGKMKQILNELTKLSTGNVETPSSKKRPFKASQDDNLDQRERKRQEKRKKSTPPGMKTILPLSTDMETETENITDKSTTSIISLDTENDTYKNIIEFIICSDDQINTIREMKRKNHSLDHQIQVFAETLRERRKNLEDPDSDLKMIYDKKIEEAEWIMK
ncbi:hypothetical protein LAZ67_1006658, partial [Cordylochernes scorpioides]